MNFNDINELKKAGFTVFKTMADLFTDSTCIPKEKGVYFVLYNENKYPEFLEVGTGGFHKGKNLNYPISKLEKNWVENTLVINIGKAGGDRNKSTLEKRLKLYFSFGKGNDAPHRGGRSIWQLKNSSKLIVCWKILTTEDPRQTEKELIRNFDSQYGKRPFANLVR